MPVSPPFSVRKKLGLVKPGEEPAVAAAAAPSAGAAPSSAPPNETTAATSSGTSALAAAGIAADPALLKEINQRLRVIEASLREDYHEESYLPSDIYHYEEAGLKERAGSVPVWLSALYILIGVLGVYYFFSNIL